MRNLPKSIAPIRDVFAQRPSKARRVDGVDGYFISSALLMLAGTGRKTGGFPWACKL